MHNNNNNNNNTIKRENRGSWENILMYNEYLRNTAGHTTKSMYTEIRIVI